MNARTQLTVENAVPKVIDNWAGRPVDIAKRIVQDISYAEDGCFDYDFEGVPELAEGSLVVTKETLETVVQLVIEATARGRHE